MANTRSGYKQKRTATDGRDPVACSECGLVVAGRGGHRRSIFHLNHVRIKALLETPCITYTEIGRRFGVTREMARQWARDLGFLVSERSDVCSLRRTFRAMDETVASRPILRELKAVCETQGFVFSLVVGNYVHKNIVRINGLRCGVVHAHVREGYGSNVVNLHRPRLSSKGVTFVLYWVETLDLWLVVPVGSLPAGSTMFSLTEPDAGRPGAYSNRKDWRGYIDAWHLLTPEPVALPARREGLIPIQKAS